MTNIRDTTAYGDRREQPSASLFNPSISEAVKAEIEAERRHRAVPSYSSQHNGDRANPSESALPVTNITENQLIFSPALEAVRRQFSDLFRRIPDDSPDEHIYYRTGASGELYAGDQNGERLLTSAAPNSTLLERTIDGIRGFTNNFQFFAGRNEQQDNQLSLHTIVGDITFNRSDDGHFHVAIENQNKVSEIILRSQEELQKFVSGVNRVLRRGAAVPNPNQTAAANTSASESAVAQSSAIFSSQSLATNSDGIDTAGATNDEIAQPNSIAIDYETGIATITGGDSKQINYDFNTGDMGVGGFGLGNFVFRHDGSTVMSNGDVIDECGVLTTYQQILAQHTDAQLTAAANQAETNARALSSAIISRASRGDITQGEIVALLALSNSLAALEIKLGAANPTLSQARSAIAEALNIALMPRKDKFKESEGEAITFASPYVSVTGSPSTQFHNISMH